MSAVHSAVERISIHPASATQIRNAGQSEKAEATLKAKFAMAGHQVYDGDNKDFLVTRWGMSHYCQDLSDLQAFAKKLGVTP